MDYQAYIFFGLTYFVSTLLGFKTGYAWCKKVNVDMIRINNQLVAINKTVQNYNKQKRRGMK